MTGRRKFMREEVVTNAVLTTDDSMELSEDWASWVKGELKEEDEVFAHSMERVNEKEEVVPELKEKCTWDTHQRNCPKCKKAIGMMRPHHKNKSNSQNVLSCDLSGPHPAAIGPKYTYLLVAVFHTR